MGTVYKAFDPLLARIVAVKVISTQLSGQPDQRERFFREARAAAQLDHPNIITVYDLGEQDGAPYLAMQFLEGQDLEQRMRAPEGMSLAAKLEVAFAIASGLAHAHSCGVVHRDVKPANVFITFDGLVKILDFGLARLVTSELTRSNVMVGTVNYMAPEQLRSEKADHRADIFSLGVVLYELIGGRRPFQADSFASTMYKILEETPEPLERLAPNAPAGLIAIVDRAMAKSAADRYQLMSDLLRDLESAYQSVLRSEQGRDLRATARLAPGVRPKSSPSAAPSDPDAPTVVRPATPSPEWVRPRSPLPRTPSPAPDAPTLAPTVPVALLPPTPRSRWRLIAGVAAALLAVVIAGVLLVVGGRTPPAAEPPAVTAPPPTAGAPSPTSKAGTATQEPAATSHPSPAAAPAPGARSEPAAPTEAAGAPRAESSDAERARVTRAAAALRSSRADAVAADAPAEVPELFAAADRQAAEARTVQSRGRLTEAAARMEAAAALFDTARSTAARQAEAREAARAAQAARRDAAAKPSPAVSAPAPPAAAATPPVEPPPAPAPTTPAPPPAGATAARPAPAPAAEPLNVPSETRVARDAALAVLGRYISALEHRDIGALRALWPGLAGRERGALEAEFANASSIEVSVDSPKVDVTGSRATVSGVRHYALRTRDGQNLRSETLTTLVLRRVNNDWQIESVRHQPVR